MATETKGWHLGLQRTINGVFRTALDQAPDKTFLHFLRQGKITYREFDAECTRLTHGLQSLGVVPGKTVVAMLDNNLDAVLLWFATLRLGGIFVPINTALKGQFLVHQLQDSTAAVVAAEPDYIERFVPVARELTHLKKLLCRGPVPPALARSKLPIEPLDNYRLRSGERIEIEAQPSDIAGIIYTGGTTGPSKGCMLPHNTMLNLSQQRIDHDRRTGDEIAWTNLPFFHANALCWTILAQVWDPLESTCRHASLSIL